MKMFQATFGVACDDIDQLTIEMMTIPDQRKVQRLISTANGKRGLSKNKCVDIERNETSEWNGRLSTALSVDP